ncbi:hypothetical protein ES708_13697 [subsurface metagenome]
MLLIGRLNKGGKFHQIGLLLFKQLLRNESCFGLRSAGESPGGPIQGLSVQVLQIGKAPSGEEVCLQGEEVTLFARFPVGEPYPMGFPGKTVPPGKGNHLGMKHRLLPGSVQHRQVGVVDDTRLGRIAKEMKRLMKETLHEKAVEADGELYIPHLAVAEIHPATHQFPTFLTESHGIHRGVVLHLVSWDVRIFLTALLRLFSDTVFS